MNTKNIFIEFFNSRKADGVPNAFPRPMGQKGKKPKEPEHKPSAAAPEATQVDLRIAN